MQLTQNYDDGGNFADNIYCYDAFGQLLGDDRVTNGYENAPFDSVGFGGQFGYYQDIETGLYELGARYYDAGKGRFVNRDPIGYQGGANLYGFCQNNPVNESDPEGTTISVYPTGDQKRDAQTLTELNQALDLLEKKVGKQAVDLITKLQSPTVTVYIYRTDFQKLKNFGTGKTITTDEVDEFTGVDKELDWDPLAAQALVNDENTKYTGTTSPATVLYHELAHAYLFDFEPDYEHALSNKRDPDYDNQEEKFVIEQYETPAAKALGEDTRTNHNLASFGPAFVRVKNSTIQPMPPPQP